MMYNFGYRKGIELIGQSGINRNMHSRSMVKNVHYGWMIPTGKQRLPTTSIERERHVHHVLKLISGRFQSAWIPDHLMDNQEPIPEALVTLSHFSGMFPDLMWGTAVLSQSFRNPALLAKMGATLQELTNFRFILGVGAGWKADEYQAYGYDFPKASVRIAQMAEMIQICKAMWNPKQKEATFRGTYYQIDKASCQPKPALPPPIMIGGGGEKLTLRIVAEHADWWNLPGASPQEYAHKLKILEQYCTEYGRSADKIRKTWMGVVSISESRETAQKQIEKYTMWPGDTPLVGTPTDIHKQLQAYIELGIDLFILSFVDEPNLAGVKTFMDYVMN